MNSRAHVFVSGKVQGVYYRSSTEKEARKLTLTGWVRNLKDGRVEAVFEGEEENINKMIKWCWLGPEYSSVKEVKVLYEEYKGEFSGFSVTH